MKHLVVRRGVVGVAATALSVAGLVALEGRAGAVVGQGYVGVNASFSRYNDSCVGADVTSTNPAHLTWDDNGVPVSQSHSHAGTYTDPGNPADVVDVASSGTITASATPIDGGPAVVTGSSVVKASALPRLATTACDSYANFHAESEGEFVLPAPMWATISATGDGNGNGYVEIDSPDGSFELKTATRSEGTVTALIPAGQTDLYFQAYVNAASKHAQFRTETYSASFRIDLKPLGAASPVTGRGAGYAVLGARDCTSGRINADVTKKAGKKAQRVLVKVNGTKVADLKGKKVKKRTLTLPVAASASAEVAATIVLENGKRLTVSRSYLACS